MRNCDYRAVKEAIKRGEPISKAALDQLKTLSAMYELEIQKLMRQSDVRKAMYFKEDHFEIIGLIKQAKVIEEG